MTALDPSPIIAELREQWATLGQFAPEDVWRLISTTEKTGELPVLSFPRGGRSMGPEELTRYGTGAPVLALVSSVCGARHPEHAVLCGQPTGPDHGPDHIAYGISREIVRWPAAYRGDRRTSPLTSSDHHGDDRHGSEGA